VTSNPQGKPSGPLRGVFLSRRVCAIAAVLESTGLPDRLRGHPDSPRRKNQGCPPPRRGLLSYAGTAAGKLRVAQEMAARAVTESAFEVGWIDAAKRVRNLLIQAPAKYHSRMSVMVNVLGLGLEFFR
jgi:hypothetical protein